MCCHEITYKVTDHCAKKHTAVEGVGVGVRFYLNKIFGSKKPTLKVSST